MSKIHDITVTPEMQEELLVWLEEMPDEDAAALGDLLPGGFRKPKMIRERLKLMIQGQATLPPWLIQITANSFTPCAGVNALSFRALIEHFDLLAMVAGASKLLVALAVDDRPEVRRLALDHLNVASQVISDADKDAASNLWADIVNSTFMELAGLKITSEPTQDSEIATDPDDVQRLRQEVDDQAQALAQLREKLEKERADRIEERRLLMAEAKSEQARLASDIDRLEQQLIDAGAEKAAIQKQCQELEQASRAAVQSAVKAELAISDRRWLADALIVESTVAQNSSADLLLRAKEALEAQSALDRHSGNRRQLSEKLQQLRAALEELNDARENAINPICELAAIADQLSAEIARIEKKLGSRPREDGVIARLLPQINDSPELHALHQHISLVESLCEAGLLTAEQTRHAYSALQRRHDILLAKSQRSGKGPLDHWLSFPSLLHHNADCQLLLDGHNILFALDHVQLYFDNGVPGLNARNRLIELVQHLIAGHPNVHARIIFDSPTESLQTVSSNLLVEFSGGNGDHRADDAIIRHLTQKGLQELRWRTFVITNDRDLQRRIRTHHAYYMPAGAFDLALRDFNCL